MRHAACLLVSLLALPGAGSAQAPDRVIADLAGRPAVVRAFAVIDSLHERTLADQIALTEIPAPPFGEERRALRFLELLEAAGADSVWMDAEGNALALRRGLARDRTVAVTAHLDTVFPEDTDVTVRIAADTLRAPGIADDARGLVVILTVLRAMVAADLRADGDLLFVGTVGEEGLGDLRGVKHLFREGAPRIDAFISVDGPDPERIVHQALGSHRYRVTFRGPGGHSWSAFGLANPHHALGTAIDHFVTAADAYTAAGPRTSYNVGRIGGGTSINSIPFESWMEIDMRSMDAGRLVEMDSILHRAARAGLETQNALRHEGPPLDVTLDLVGDRPSGSIPAEHPFIRLAVAATRHLGYDPTLQRSSTDANVPISLGIPSLTTGGGGRSDHHHALDEYWVDEDSDRGIKRILLIALAGAAMR